MGYYDFPHTRNYDTDLGYLINWFKTNRNKIEENTAITIEKALTATEDAIKAYNSATSASNSATSASNSAALALELKNQTEELKNLMQAKIIQIDTNTNRINNLATIDPGSVTTTGDAELVDIRVGANRITYPSAGDSVRGQVSELKSDIEYSKKGISLYKDTFNTIAGDYSFDIDVDLTNLDEITYSFISYEGAGSPIGACYVYTENKSSFTLLGGVQPSNEAKYRVPNDKIYKGIRFRINSLKTGSSNVGKLSLAIEKLKNKITVGNYSFCDYIDIQSAIDNCYDSNDLPIEIFIYNGIYSRFSMSDSNKLRYISLVGESKENTIVLGNTGKYEEATAEIRTKGTIKNITFKQIATSETYVEGTHPYCYAMHDDYNDDNAVFENCTFISNAGPAVGLGLRENLTKEFINCDFICEADGTYGVNTLGALFGHNHLKNNANNQGLYLRNCRFINKYGERGISLTISGGYTGTYDVQITTCGIWGTSQSPQYIMMPQSYSYGNSINTISNS